MPRNYHIAKEHIVASMPGTVAELVRKSGWSHDTVVRWVKKLRKEGASHIVGWERPNGGGPFVSVHGAGAGEDVPCTLKPLTPSEDWAKAKEKYGMELLRKKERARKWALEARRGRNDDPLMAALFP